jgi:hypothetical protein
MCLRALAWNFSATSQTHLQAKRKLKGHLTGSLCFRLEAFSS